MTDSNLPIEPLTEGTSTEQQTLVEITDDKMTEWKKAFEELVIGKLESMPGSNTPVLQLQQYNDIIAYKIACKRSGGSAMIDEENSKLKTKQWRWKTKYNLQNDTVLLYSNTDEVVSHTGRMFADLVEVYCPQKKHVHNTDEKTKQEHVKARYGRSITVECINFFLSSCPMCIDLNQAKPVPKKLRDEVKHLKEQLAEKETEVQTLQALINDIRSNQSNENGAQVLNLQFLGLDSGNRSNMDTDANSLDSRNNEGSFEDTNRGREESFSESGSVVHRDFDDGISDALLLYSKIHEINEAKNQRKTRSNTPKTPIKHFWASLRSILYTVGLSEVIKRVDQRYNISNLTNNATATATETRESDSVLRTLQKMVGEDVQFKTTTDAISSYLADATEANNNKSHTESELFDVLKELAQLIDDETWVKVKKECEEATNNFDGWNDYLLDLLDNEKFEDLRKYFKDTPTTTNLLQPNFVILKHCIEFLAEYIARHNELEKVLKLMEFGEDIETTTDQYSATYNSVTHTTNGGVVPDVSLCLEKLLKWLSLEDLFFVTVDKTKSLYLKVSTKDKSKPYKMATLLESYHIDDHCAYVVIIREGNHGAHEARIDDVLSLCLDKGKKIYAVLRSFVIRYPTDDRYDAYVTSKYEKNTWTLLDGAKVYVDAKEALALSSYAKCYLYELLTEDNYNALANREDSAIKKLEKLSEDTKIVASALSVGLRCFGAQNVEEDMLQLLVEHYLMPNCYPQLFMDNKTLSDTGKLYLEEALCIKECCQQDVCNQLMKKYLEKWVPLSLFPTFDDKKAVAQVFKQHIINKITTDLGIYLAPIKCDELYSTLAEWTIERNQKANNL